MSTAYNTSARDTRTEAGPGTLVENRPPAPELKAQVQPPSRPAAASPRQQPALDSREVRRRLWHIAPGFFPFILWFIPHQDPYTWDLKTPALLIIAFLAIQIFRRFATFGRSKSDEQGRLGAVLGYALSVSLMILCVPGYGELAFMVLAILAFGDGLATVGGLYFQGPRLPWNRDKTWSGFVSFIVAATVFGSIVYWGEANPQLPFGTALQVGAFAGILAAICESLPSKINDNIRVGVSASAGALLAQWIFVGY